jgi:hypothetical protein
MLFQVSPPYRAPLGGISSGLQAICLMLAGFKQATLEHAVGIKLEEPFLTALELFQQLEESA